MLKVYLASPYYHKDSKIRHDRFVAVCKKAGELMNHGYFVYSPIAHSHPISVQCDLPKAWSFWEIYDTEYIQWVDELWVLKLDGWDKSNGIKAEIAIAEKNGKPVKKIEI